MLTPIRATVAAALTLCAASPVPAHLITGFYPLLEPICISTRHFRIHIHISIAFHVVYIRLELDPEICPDLTRHNCDYRDADFDVMNEGRSIPSHAQITNNRNNIISTTTSDNDKVPSHAHEY